MSDNEINLLIINEFIKLANKIKYHDIELSSTDDEKKKNIFRLLKIENAIKIFKKYSKKITSGSQFENYPNIGKNIIMRINEILQNKKLSELDNFNFNEKQQTYIDNLSSVLGIGYKNANKLVYKYKIHTVDELIMAISKNKIKVSPYILKSLRYHNIYKKEIPHDEITIIFNIISNIIKTINSKIISIICGSYRRNLPFSNDIDLLISIKNKKNNINYLKIIIEKLKKKNIIIDSLTTENAKTKYIGFIKINNYPVRKIDIIFIDYNSFYTSLLYFTGSKNFNRYMRKIAKKQGFKLNEYGLFKNNQQIIIHSEKNIFDKLNIPFVHPSDRN